MEALGWVLIVLVVVALLAVVVMTVLQLPDIRRYLKIRSM